MVHSEFKPTLLKKKKKIELLLCPAHCEIIELCEEMHLV